MVSNQFDLVVVGSGPAGQKGAIAAAKLGKRVAIVDREEMIGGVCLQTGTIPSKTVREAILYLSGFRQRSFYGQDYSLKQNISVADLSTRVNRVRVSEKAVIKSQLNRNNVITFNGKARFVDPHSLEIEGNGRSEILTGGRVLIACGTRAARTPGIPFGKHVLDADQVGQIEHIPRELIVVGAGVIGLEYASMLTALNVKVTVIDQKPTILDFVDHEIAEALSSQMRRQGVVFRLGEKVTSVEIDEHGMVRR
jgi:NAD(P) transhydrogenase